MRAFDGVPLRVHNGTTPAKNRAVFNNQLGGDPARVGLQACRSVAATRGRNDRRKVCLHEGH